MVKTLTRTHLESVRTLVRYVDEEQAVIEVHTLLRRSLPACDTSEGGGHQSLELFLELRSRDGFNDEQCLPLTVRHRRATVRFDVVHPRLWWPAGMGEQPLYELAVSLLVAGQPSDLWTTTLGFTSVKAQRVRQQRTRRPLLMMVNGQPCDIGAVVAVDRVDERRLLPAAGDSLLLVRDHYGPDVLYEAADRAGIMLIQCIPIHPEARPEKEVPAQVSRLASHPSLAGWVIGHQGQVSCRIARRLARLDPMRSLITLTDQEWVQ